MKRVTNTIDRLTENSMAGALRRIQAPAPQKDNMLGTQERIQGVDRAHVAGVEPLLTAFFGGGMRVGEDMFHSRSLQSDFLIPKQEAGKGVGSRSYGYYYFF